MEEDYFRDHPDEIGPYIDEIFDAYAEDGNSAALLASLRVIAKVKGIMQALGYRLKPQPINNIPR